MDFNIGIGNDNDIFSHTQNRKVILQTPHFKSPSIRRFFFLGVRKREKEKKITPDTFI